MCLYFSADLSFTDFTVQMPKKKKKKRASRLNVTTPVYPYVCVMNKVWGELRMVKGKRKGDEERDVSGSRRRHAGTTRRRCTVSKSRARLVTWPGSGRRRQVSQIGTVPETTFSPRCLFFFLSLQTLKIRDTFAQCKMLIYVKRLCLWCQTSCKTERSHEKMVSKSERGAMGFKGPMKEKAHFSQSY